MYQSNPRYASRGLVSKYLNLLHGNNRDREDGDRLTCTPYETCE